MESSACGGGAGGGGASGELPEALGPPSPPAAAAADAMKRQNSLTSKPFAMIRQASGRVTKNCQICLSPVGLAPGAAEDLRLGCQCLVHYSCLIQYIRTCLGNKTMLLHSIPQGEDRPGIICPMSSAKTCQFAESGEANYFLTVADLELLIEYGETNRERLAGEQEEEVGEPLILTRVEAEKLRLWLADTQSQKLVPDSDDAMINATTKPCPKCNYRASHLHGHHCHHVSRDGGCINCKTNFCYKCLQSGPDNLQIRGGESECLCGGWSNFCTRIETPRQAKLFIKLAPYPVDIRCGCAICPDCSKGSRGGNCGCDGDCLVCKGYVLPGPRQLGTEWVPQSAEMIAAAPKHPPSRCMFDSCQAGDLEDAIEVLSLNGSAEFDWTKTDERDQSYLGHAILSGNIELVNWLLDIGARADATARLARKSVQPVHLAASVQRIDIIEALVRTGVQLDVRDRDGRNCLFHSCNTMTVADDESVDLSVVQFLVEKGCVDRADDKGDTALYGAALNGKAACVHFLASLPGADINKGNRRKKTPLHIACGRQQSKVIELLLSIPGIKIDAKDDKNRTPLFAAAGSKDPKCVELLLEAPGADTAFDVNALDSEGWSILHYACQEGAVATIQALRTLRPELQINPKTTGSGTTPFMMAAHKGHMECLRYLMLLPETDVNEEDKEGFTALLSACKHGSADCVKTLITHPQIKLNVQEKRGRSAWYQACHYGQVDCLKVLVDLTAPDAVDVNLPDKSGLPPIHAAIGENKKRVLEYLVSLPQVNVNATDRDGINAFMLAVKRDRSDCVKMLAACPRCDINAKTREGETALFLACKRGDSGQVRLVLSLEHASDTLNEGDSKQRTPLFIAARDGRESCVKELLASPGILLNKADEQGSTPCHAASSKNESSSLKLLLAHDATDVNAQDKDGDTPLHVACIEKGAECVKLLLAHKSIDVNRTSAKGSTPLHEAAAAGSKECVKLLLKNPNIDVNMLNNAGASAVTLSKSFDVKHLLLDAGATLGAGEQAFEAARVGDVVRLKHLARAVVQDQLFDCAERASSIVSQLEPAASMPQPVLAEALSIIRELAAAKQSLANSSNEAFQWTHPNHDLATPFLIACSGGKLEAVKFLASLVTDDDLNQTNKKGQTGIHLACSTDRQENNQTVEFLISQQKIKPNALDSSGRTAFEFAISLGNVGCAQLLVPLYGDVNKPAGGIEDLTQDQRLSAALKVKKLRLVCPSVQLRIRSSPSADDSSNEVGLLSNGAIVKVYDEPDWNTVNGFYRLVNGKGYIMINAPGAKFQDLSNPAKDKEKNLPPLLLACRGRQMASVKLLCSLPDIDINRGGGDSGETPLFAATKIGETSIVEFLAARADIEDKADSQGNTVLHVACTNSERIACVKALIASGRFDLNRPNAKGRTPLALASFSGCTVAVEALMLATGVDLNRRDFNGRSPLFLASMAGKKDAVQALATVPGVDLDSEDLGGMTPADAAKSSEIKKMLDSLLDVPPPRLSFPPLASGSVVMRGPDWDYEAQDHDEQGNPSRGVVVGPADRAGWYDVRWANDSGGDEFTYRYDHEERHIMLVDPGPGAAVAGGGAGGAVAGGGAVAPPAPALDTPTRPRGPGLGFPAPAAVPAPAPVPVLRPPRTATSFPPLSTGMAVVRGPDWRWNTQDHHNGQPCQGVIVRPDSPGWWTVRWASGQQNNYEYTPGDYHIMLAGPPLLKLRLLCAEGGPPLEVLSGPDSAQSVVGSVQVGAIIEIVDEPDKSQACGFYELSNEKGFVKIDAPGVSWQGPPRRAQRVAPCPSVLAGQLGLVVTSTRHAHTLERRLGSSWSCDGAGLEGGCKSGHTEGFTMEYSWRCVECDFDLCILCAADSCGVAIPETVHSIQHKHPLTKLLNPYGGGLGSGSYGCDGRHQGCKAGGTGSSFRGYTWHCSRCNFDFCPHCAVSESKLAGWEPGPCRGLQLYMSAASGHVASLQPLVQEWRGSQTCNWANPAEDDKTPLSAAAKAGHVECVSILLADPGIDVNKRDRAGRSPIFHACKKGHKDVVTALLAAYAVDVNAKTDAGKTPLGAAKDEEIQRLLQSAGGVLGEEGPGSSSQRHGAGSEEGDSVDSDSEQQVMQELLSGLEAGLETESDDSDGDSDSDGSEDDEDDEDDEDEDEEDDDEDADEDDDEDEDEDEDEEVEEEEEEEAEENQPDAADAPPGCHPG